jgi:hypothetical protein
VRDSNETDLLCQEQNGFQESGWSLKTFCRFFISRGKAEKTPQNKAVSHLRPLHQNVPLCPEMARWGSKYYRCSKTGAAAHKELRATPPPAGHEEVTRNAQAEGVPRAGD